LVEAAAYAVDYEFCWATQARGPSLLPPANQPYIIENPAHLFIGEPVPRHSEYLDWCKRSSPPKVGIADFEEKSFLCLRCFDLSIRRAF
jgi:hypothetical protein